MDDNDKNKITVVLGNTVTSGARLLITWCGVRLQTLIIVFFSMNPITEHPNEIIQTHTEVTNDWITINVPSNKLIVLLILFDLKQLFKKLTICSCLTKHK